MTAWTRRVAGGWRSLPAAEKAGAAGMLGAIAALNAAGWGIFAVAILPHHFKYNGLGAGLGVGFTAWTLGARHAFDSDHIAAIDNTTRKLLADGKRPLGTGFFFALGHSSIILVVGTGITIASKSVFHAVVTPVRRSRPLAGSRGRRCRRRSSG
jgi:nickel/cobalt transporter (NiCoT) family protein